MFFENIKEALASISSNKMRSVLTMLGIIIGISSVITITTIGSSIKSTLNSTLNSLGGNTISFYVEAKYPETDEEWDTWTYPEMEESDYVTQEMVDALLNEFPDELGGIVLYERYQAGKVTSGDRYANVNITGVTPEYLTYMKLKMHQGRSITDADYKGNKNVAIICDTMAKNYFGKENPLGQEITVDCVNGSSLDLVVVGVYEYSNAMFGKPDTSVREKDRMTTIFTPVSYIQMAQSKEFKGYSSFDVIVNNEADIQTAQDKAKEFLDQYYEGNKNFEIYAFNAQSEMGMIDTVINVITVAISFIAAISLVVGGVGVMNIMLVSITERTREIGVRMALGAKRRTIRLQFVIEAIVLCIIGGIIGILIGVANGFALGAVAEALIQNVYSDYAQYIIMSVHPSLKAILLSLFFSMLIGVFFGYYPANKASKMEVIDALRYE